MLIFISFILLLLSKQIHAIENIQPIEEEEMEEKFIQNPEDVFVNSSINLIGIHLFHYLISKNIINLKIVI